jgi:hypothetical protein
MRSRRSSIAVLALVSMTLAAGLAHAACSDTPLAGCKQPFVAGQSTLTFFQTTGNDPDDIFTWRWLSGSATTLADFGAPPATEYAFCIYDQSRRPQPVIADLADDPTGWNATRGGFAYLLRGSHPLRTARLHAGVDGKAFIRVHGNADTVGPLLPFVAPVVAQLQASNGQCWETDFPTAIRSSAAAFGARD